MKFLPQDIISVKRDKNALTAEHIQYWVESVSKGEISDSQIAALNMAILLNGMDYNEVALLTKAMSHSGEVIDWRKHIGDAPVLDKHSTGGVGDKTSFLIAPILAALNCYVPMISGRSLGHTGGTLDKLEAIEGLSVHMELADFIANIKKNRLAIIAANKNMAPADGRIYAVRDETATVSSQPLIVSSILSKKMAAGVQNLIMDVKYGIGSFNKTREAAKNLAEALTKTAQFAGLHCHALITDMNETLGFSIGNSLEIFEIIDGFNHKEKREQRLWQVSQSLAAQALIIAGIESDSQKAQQKVNAVIDNGKAAEFFETMIHSQGGPHNLLSQADKYLPKAPVQIDVYSNAAGYITAQDCYKLAMMNIRLGGGRTHKEQKLDYSVGFTNIQKIGQYVDNQTPLLRLHAASDDDAQMIVKELQSAFVIGDEKPIEQNPILDVIL